jgi:hypothetical protein
MLLKNNDKKEKEKEIRIEIILLLFQIGKPSSLVNTYGISCW